jgi:hypothetical protein
MDGVDPAVHLGPVNGIPFLFVQDVPDDHIQQPAVKRNGLP